MAPAEAVDCYFKAGDIKIGQDDFNAARQMFLNALELEPEHEPSLRKLLRIVEAAEDKHGLVDVKQRLLQFATDDLERFKLLVDIGDSHLELDDASKAEQAYREAVKVDPNSKVVLHKLLNIFTGTGNWRRATEVLGQLARMEGDPERLAKLCFTIAAIFRDELGEMEQAVEFFNQALDAKFDYLEAFEAIDHLLTSARDWHALEQNYRRMVARVEAEGGPNSVDLKVTLLKNLGEIYRSRMQNYDDAIAAYQLASSLSPQDEVLITILAELMQLAGRSNDDIIEQHQRLINVSPFRIESYRALFQNFVKLERFDEAGCISAALCLLQKAQPEEEQYYTRYLPPNVRQAKSEFTPQFWKDRLYHPDLDRNITSLFELLGIHLRPRIRRDVKDWGLHKKKDKIELQEQTPLTKMTHYVMSRVGVSALSLYEKPDHVGLTNMNVEPPALVVGRDMLGGKSQRELAFQVAKAVTLMRPEFYLASALPSTEYLKTFFFAATSVVTGQVQGENTADIVTYAHEIQELPTPVLEQVKRAVTAVFDSGRNPDLSAWLRAVDHTSSRAGLLISGDLRTAVACMKMEFEGGRAISKADMKERVRELILFNISNEYFSLRRDLGLALAKK
jgi:tetratricopeptide (TPR) repeat protein